MQGRGERVVRGLRAVDVIIRVQQPPARQLVAAVRDDLVCVHVRLRAGAGLPDDKRKVVCQLSGDNFIGRGADGAAFFCRHGGRAQTGVRQSGRLFQDAECVDDLRRHGLAALPDREVFKAALRLRAPIAVRRHADVAHGVVLHAIFHILHLRSGPCARIFSADTISSPPRRVKCAGEYRIKCAPQLFGLRGAGRGVKRSGYAFALT